MGIRDFFQHGYASVKRFCKKHPTIALGLVGAFIAASVFTGGAILAVPTALATMALIGVIVGSALSAILTMCGIIAIGDQIKNKCQDQDQDSIEHVKPGIPGPSVALGLVCAPIAFVGTAMGILASPLAGIIFCGIGVVSLFTAFCAGLGHAISFCFSRRRAERTTRPASSVGLSVSSESPVLMTNSYSNMPNEFFVTSKQHSSTHSDSAHAGVALNSTADKNATTPIRLSATANPRVALNSTGNKSEPTLIRLSAGSQAVVSSLAIYSGDNHLNASQQGDPSVPFVSTETIVPLYTIKASRL